MEGAERCPEMETRRHSDCSYALVIQFYVFGYITKFYHSVNNSPVI